MLIFREIYRSLYELLNPLERVYLYGFIALQLYTGLVHGLVFGDLLEFLPLLLTSVYCATGVMYGWILAMYACLR